MLSVKEPHKHNDVAKLTIAGILKHIKGRCQLAVTRALGIGLLPGLLSWRLFRKRQTLQETKSEKIPGAKERNRKFRDMIKGLQDLYEASVASQKEVITLTNELISSKDELLASKDELIAIQERYIAVAENKMATQDAAMATLEDAFRSCQNLVRALLDLPVFRDEVGEEFRERLVEILHGGAIEDGSETDSDYSSGPE